MTTRTRILLIVVAVIIVAYPAAAWLTGIGVESQLQRNERQLLNENNYMVLIGREYHRGIYGATEELTYGLGGPLARLNTLPAGRMLASLRLTVRNTIHHGPFPGLRAFGLASVDSQVHIATTPGSPVGAALSDKPFVQIHSVIGWLGSTKSTIQSPALQYRAADGTQFNWRGISGTIVAGRNMNTWSGTLLAPGLDVRDAKASIELTGLNFSAHKRRVFDAFYIGDSQFKLASAEFRPVGGDPVLVQGVSLQSTSATSPADAQYVDATGNISADSIQAPQFSATRVGYDMGFSHVHGPSLAALTLALRDMQRNATSAADQGSRMLDVIRQYGPDVALHEPVFTISRIGFVMPEGELRLSGKLVMPGLRREDLQGPMAIAALAQHVQASFDLRVDTALADKLLGTSARGAVFAAQLQQFERQGYLKRDGSSYTTHIDYQQGKVSINGLSYPPVPAAAATP